MLSWFKQLLSKPAPLPPAPDIQRDTTKDTLKVMQAHKRSLDSATKQLEGLIQQYGLDDQMKGADPHRVADNLRHLDRS